MTALSAFEKYGGSPTERTTLLMYFLNVTDACRNPIQSAGTWWNLICVDD
jgi:hypothetical protein